ncbi:MAG: hypothetical protein ACE5KT_06075 [Methanosarcinales archaeon]
MKTKYFCASAILIIVSCLAIGYTSSQPYNSKQNLTSALNEYNEINKLIVNLNNSINNTNTDINNIKQYHEDMILLYVIGGGFGYLIGIWIAIIAFTAKWRTW